MQFSININQTRIHTQFPDLDLKDAALIDFIGKFCNSGKAKYIVYDNEQYFWIAYSLVIKQMPMIKLKSKDAIYRRFKNLCDLNIITASPHNQQSGKSYYKFGPNYQKLFYSDPTDQKPNLRSNIRRPTENETEAPTDEFRDKQLNNIYQYIIINKGDSFSDKVKNLKSRIGQRHFDALLKVCSEPDAIQLEPEKIKIYIDWLEYRKLKRKSYVTKTIAKQIELFYHHTIQECQAAYDLTESSGYDGLFFNETKKKTNGNKRKKFDNLVSAITSPA